MNIYNLLNDIWDSQHACETCGFRYKEIDYGEAWGSNFTSVVDRCKVIEEDMDPMNCPGMDAAIKRLEEDERFYG